MTELKKNLISLILWGFHPEVDKKKIIQTLQKLGPVEQIELDLDKKSKYFRRRAFFKVRYKEIVRLFTSFDILIYGKKVNCTINENIEILEMKNGLIVKNLPQNISDQVLKNVFEKFGKIKYFKIESDLR